MEFESYEFTVQEASSKIGVGVSLRGFILREGILGAFFFSKGWRNAVGGSKALVVC